jgi:hypothetical protein
MASAATTTGLSDEDDSAERVSVLQSPPKGMKRISSGVGLYVVIHQFRVAFLIFAKFLL